MSAFEAGYVPPIVVDAWTSADGSTKAWCAAAIELVTGPAAEGDPPEAVLSSIRSRSARILAALRPWENQGTLEYRIVGGAGSPTLRYIFIARALGASQESARAWAEAMLRTVVGLFPKTYVFAPVGYIANDFRVWYEIQRAEERREPGPYVDRRIASYYYLVHRLSGDGAGWHAIPSIILNASSQTTLSVCFLPTSLSDGERAAIDHVSTHARYLSEPQPGFDFFGNQQSTPGDAGALDVLSCWNVFPERRGFLIRIGVTSGLGEIDHLASQLASSLSQTAPNSGIAPGRYAVVRDLSEYEAWSTYCLGVPIPRERHPVWALPPEEAPASFHRIPNFHTEEDAAALFALPLPDDQGIVGLKRAEAARSRRSELGGGAEDEPGTAIGRAIHEGVSGREMRVPLTALNRHSLVVGIPGFGKTTTIQTVLESLWNDHRLPWTVIEPGKPEYRNFLNVPGVSYDLTVITVGRESISPLRLNPLEPPPGVRRSMHESAVYGIFLMSMPLHDPLPQLLRSALDRVYSVSGWDEDTTLADDVAPPTLRDLIAAFSDVFSEAGYQHGTEAQNIGVAFTVRMRSLLVGNIGKVLDTRRSNDLEEILSRPVVFELSEIQNDEDQALLGALLLHQIRGRARARGSSGGQLRHLTVVEEAHNLLPADVNGTTSSTQSRAKAVEQFVNAIAELRSFGEGFMICSQNPSRLAQGAIRNTNVRIIHHLESEDEREAMLSDVGADPQDRDVARELSVGTALVKWAPMLRPQLVRTIPPAGVDTSSIPSDEDVKERMTAHRATTQSVLPYALCTVQVCSKGCEGTVRNRGRSISIQARPLLLDKDAPGDFSARMDAVTAAVRKSTPESLSEQQIYCACAQLIVDGVNGRAGLPLGANVSPIADSLLASVRRANGMG